MIVRRNFCYLQTRALSFLTINCKMESQKHATRFDLRYDSYSGLWCHKPMKELGFECDFVKLTRNGSVWNALRAGAGRNACSGPERQASLTALREAARIKAVPANTREARRELMTMMRRGPLAASPFHAMRTSGWFRSQQACRRNQVLDRWPHLRPATGLAATIGIEPETL